jgi:hypothetical protein
MFVLIEAAVKKAAEFPVYIVRRAKMQKNHTNMMKRASDDTVLRFCRFTTDSVAA